MEAIFLPHASSTFGNQRGVVVTIPMRMVPMNNQNHAGIGPMDQSNGSSECSRGYTSLSTSPIPSRSSAVLSFRLVWRNCSSLMLTRRYSLYGTWYIVKRTAPGMNTKTRRKIPSSPDFPFFVPIEIPRVNNITI